MSVKFKKYEGLVQSIARKFSQKGSADTFDELYGQACLCYILAIKSYDPAQGSEVGWIMAKVMHGLTEHCRALWRQGAFHHLLGDQACRLPAKTNVHLRPWWRDLDADGRILVDLACHPCVHGVVPLKPETIWGHVLCLLYEVGWDESRIERAFNNVQDCLYPSKVACRSDRGHQTSRPTFQRPIPDRHGYGIGEDGHGCQVVAAPA